MRKIFLYMVAIACLTACGKSAKLQLDYLPCQNEVGKGWGFIDQDGEVVLDGRFQSQPSVVSDGLFTLQQGDMYQLYRLDGGEAQLLLDSLAMAGIPAFGRVPVCKEAGKIAVVDKSGQPVFVLDQFQGQAVVGSAPQYTYGYLEIETVNSMGIHHSALVDRDGEMVLPPHYSDLVVLNPDLIWVMQETVDNRENDSTSQVRRTAYFVDRKGMMLHDKPHNLTDPKQVIARFGEQHEQPAPANGWTRIDYVDGFGYVGTRELKMAVLNPKTWEAVGQTVHTIAWLPADELQITNDTYAYDRTAKEVVSAYQQGLHSRGLTFPVTVPYITSLVETPAEEYNTFATSHTYSWEEQDFRVEAIAQFDTTLIRQKYTIEHTATEDMYGQPVEINKRKEDGYEYNPESHLISVDLSCFVDSAHTEIVMQKVTKLMGQQYKKREALYVDGQQIIRLSAKPGCISLHVERDPKELAREKAEQQALLDSATRVEQGKYDAAIDSAMAATDKQDSINQLNKSQQQ